MSNDKVFEGMESKRTLIFNFIKTELEISRARKEALKNLALAEYSVGESYREKKRISYMVIMCRRENRRYSKKTNVTKGYKIHEVVKCHDHLCPDWTRYTEEVPWNIFVLG